MRVDHRLKVRYLEILESEGCLNEVLFDRPHWDDDGKHCIKDHGLEKLVKMIPHDTIKEWLEDDGDCKVIDFKYEFLEYDESDR